MSIPRRPSLWRRLIGARRIDSGPDFGDMGTAFGLDAITLVSGDWQLEKPAISTHVADDPYGMQASEPQLHAPGAEPGTHTLRTSDAS